MAAPRALPADLLEEYKLCHDRAATLADNVWKTATILGAGSLTGIIVLAAKDITANRSGAWLAGLIALVAIGFLASWRRMAGRWLSIEYALLRRMEHLERMSRFRATLYTAHLDNRIQFSDSAGSHTLLTPSLERELQSDLRDIGNHQREGIRAAIDFITEINIAGWLALGLFAFSPLLGRSLARQPFLAVTIAASAAFAAFFIWRLIHMSRRL